MSYLEMVLLLMLMKRTFWTTCKKILKVHYLLLNLFYNMCVFNFFLLKNEVLFHHFIVIRVKLLYILLFWHVTHSFAFTYSSMLTLICCIQGYFHPVVFLLSFSCKRFFFSSWIVKKKFIKVRWYAKLQLAHSSIRPLTTRAKKKTGENFTGQKRHN